MAYDTRFGSRAQTPEQRALVLARRQAALPSLKTKATDFARQLYARYVARELSPPANYLKPNNQSAPIAMGCGDNC